jgi:serine/threonine-protein kinase
MSARLAGIAGLRVLTPRALTGVSAKNPDLAKVAQDTGATLVLHGALQRVADRYRVTYSLVSAPGGVQMAGAAFTGMESEMFAIQDRMADSVIAFLDVKKPAGPRRGTPGLAPGAQITYLKAIGALQHYDVPASVDTAISLLSGLNAQDPSALVLAALGRAYRNKYEVTRDPAWAEKAIASCELARKLDDRLPEVHATLGEVLALTGKPAEAKLEFEQALAGQPSSIEAMLGLANAEYATGDSGAEATYRRALALQPSYWAVYNQFGSYYYRLGRYPQAIPMFREATRLRPDSVRAYNNLGAALFKTDRFADARHAYQSSIRIKPNDGAYTNLGNLEYYVGDYRAAAGAFEEATKLTPGKYLYWANLGDAYRWTPDLKARAPAAYEKAIELAGRELSLNPKSAAAHATLATSYAKIGKVGPAWGHMEKAVELEPDNPDRLFDAAIVANITGRRGEALGWIRKAVAAGLGAAQIEREPEFRNLRGVPGFAEALEPARSRA